MIRVSGITCLVLMFIAGCRSGDDGPEPAPPGAGAAAEARAGDTPAAAAATGEEVKPGGDRPGMVRCADCRVVVCRSGDTLDGIRLDTAKLDLAGVTVTSARLRIEAGTGESVAVPVAADALLKPDRVVDGSLKGLPGPSEVDAWKASKAALVLDYQTAKGESGTAPMELGSIEIKSCL